MSAGGYAVSLSRILLSLNSAVRSRPEIHSRTDNYRDARLAIVRVGGEINTLAAASQKYFGPHPGDVFFFFFFFFVSSSRPAGSGAASAPVNFRYTRTYVANYRDTRLHFFPSLPSERISRDSFPRQAYRGKCIAGGFTIRYKLYGEPLAPRIFVKASARRARCLFATCGTPCAKIIARLFAGLTPAIVRQVSSETILPASKHTYTRFLATR